MSIFDFFRSHFKFSKKISKFSSLSLSINPRFGLTKRLQPIRIDLYGIKEGNYDGIKVKQILGNGIGLAAFRYTKHGKKQR